MRALLGGALVLWGALGMVCAQAADYGVRKGLLGDQIQLTARALESAHARRMAQLDPNTYLQPSAQNAPSLFPTWGFEPRAIQGLTYNFIAVDDDQTVVCIKRNTSNVAEWNEALTAFSAMKYQAADSSCAAVEHFSHAPNSFPATIVGRSVLDRRAVPVATRLPVYPALTGVDAAAVTRPGLSLAATTGGPGNFSTITVYNPFVLVSEGPPPVGLTIGLVEATVRPGFTVQHNCTAVAPETSCAVQVRYDGQNGNGYVGSLHLRFSNGAHATVGLLGVLQ